MRILLVMLSPVESSDSATLRTMALANGLLLANCTIDYLTIPLSKCHSVQRLNNFLNKINIIRTRQNRVYDSLNNESGIIKTKIVNVLREFFHAFSLYDYTYSIAKNLDISLLTAREYDLVISSSDPKTSHIAVERLIKQGLRYKKWIQYWGDPLALDITNKSIYPKWLISIIEKKILKRTDRIIYVSPFTLEQQRKMYPHYADKMLFFPIPYMQEKIYPETCNPKFTIGYYGDYFKDVRDIKPLYDACVLLNTEIHLDIAGNTDLNLNQTNNISVFPRIDISGFEEKADLLVCILNKKGTQIPGKLYHYAATNKPILVVLDGERKEDMIKYLESFQRYIICENDVAKIVDKIREIMNKSHENIPCRAFSPEVIAKFFLES